MKPLEAADCRAQKRLFCDPDYGGKEDGRVIAARRILKRALDPK